MANNNLNFSVALNLLTENFKKGTQEITNGLNNIKQQALQMVGFFGLGLGLKELAKDMINVAKETARVQKALKVASGSAEEYGKNQKYLEEISSKYGLKLNEITEQYAKFSAASKTSNISLKDQQELFKGVNAAMLSAGVTTDKKTAVFDMMDKMMMKNVISSKMLIGGLGTEMPEALSLMAQSMGVSVDKLRDMSKHGQLLSSDVMPKFAKVLNDTFSGVNTDTIGGAMNRIGNDFESLTKKIKPDLIYKELVKGFEKAFKWIVDNWQIVGDAMVNIFISTVVGKGIMSAYKAYTALGDKAEQTYIRETMAARKSALNKELLTSGLSKKEQAYYRASEANIIKNEVTQEASAMRTKLTWSAAYISIKTAALSAFAAFAPMLIISGIIAIVQQYQNWKTKQDEINNSLRKTREEINNAGKNSGRYQDLQNLKKIVDDTNNSYNTRKGALIQLNTILGTNFTIDEKTKKINGDINGKYAERLLLIEKEERMKKLVQKKLELEDKSEELIKNRVDKGKDYYRQKDANDKNKNDASAGQTNMGIQSTVGGLDGNRKLSNIKSDYDDAHKLEKINKTLQSDISKQISNLVADGISTGESNYNAYTSTDTTTKKPKKEKETDIEKAENDVAKKLVEYQNSLDNGQISQSKYNELYDKLNEDTVKTLGAKLTKEEAKNDKVYQDALKGTKDPLSKSDDKILAAKENYATKLSEQDEYLKNGIISQDEYTNAVASLVDETLRQISSIKGVNFANNEFVKVVKQKQKELDIKNYVFDNVLQTPIDHTFDYKKTDSEKLKDKTNQNEDFIKDIEKEFSDKGIKDIEKQIKNANGDLTKLKASFNGQADKMIDELNEALKKAPDLASALKISEVKADIKSLQKDIENGLYDGVKSVAGSAKNLFEGYSNLSKTLSNVDAKPWEKILAVWDAMTNTVDQFMSIVKMITALTEATNKLKMSQSSEKNIIKGVLQKGVTDNIKKEGVGGALSGLGGIMSGMKKEDITGDLDKKKEAGAVEVDVNKGVAVSGAIASAATLPFPFNLIEMAGAASTVMGMFNNIPKLANGGIAYGNSLVNVAEYGGASGNPEVIAPLDKLKTLIKPKESGSVGGKVEFVIDGKVIKGVLDNYSKIKKLK